MRAGALVVLVLMLAQLACAVLQPVAADPTLPAATGGPPSEASAEPSGNVSGDPTTAPGPTTAAATAAATAAPTGVPTTEPTASPPPTAAPLQLEVLQVQAWTDYLFHIRANVLLRNPYDYPVSAAGAAGVSLLDSAGELVRYDELYFLDGISGGNGFLLPGEIVAANACFTCERMPIAADAWASMEPLARVTDATGMWTTFTDVEARLGSATFEGDSPIFWVDGTVTNNSDTTLQRISARVFVYDADGSLLGAAEASAWDVPAGATVSFSGYGFGQTPAGEVVYEVTALGVNY